MNGSDLQPALLPARMLNEFAYCPRLAYLEWVQGEFRDSVDTVEGRFRHRRVEKESGALPESVKERATEDTDAHPPAEGRIHARSVLLESDRLGLVARIDLVEGEGGHVIPVDYKRGRPPDNPERAWEPERVQVCAQALLLRDHGFACDEGVLYFVQSKQRIPVPIDDDLVRRTLELRDALRAAAASGTIPPPLAGSPKCIRCSLAPICLPDETRLLAESPECERPGGDKPRPSDVRRILPTRDDAAPLYLQTQGLSVGLSGDVLEVREKGEKLREVRLIDVSQLCVFGGVQVTTSAVRELASRGIPVCYFSYGGWFQAIAHGMSHRNVELRRHQFRAAEDPARSLALARAFAAGKIRNQRTMLRRNHPDAPEAALAEMARMAEAAARATDRETLLGIEGNAARAYFEHFGALLRCGRGLSVPSPNVTAGADKCDLKSGPPGRGCPAPPGDAASAEPGKPLPPPLVSGEDGETLDFDFNGRNRRPPADPVNALLSFAYAMLVKDLAVTLLAVGFDPFLGFYHQPRYGRPALALDLMEELRPIVADSAVITAVNRREVTPKSFLRRGSGVALTDEGRKAFIKAYERRMADEATHPLFGYAASYRRILEIQARLLARHLAGEIPEYPAFETR
jgi:CRISPR-associated protein Cas1